MKDIRDSRSPSRLPPFHTSGEAEGDFYALAFVAGRMATSDQKPASLVLSWSPTPRFTRFSTMIVAAETGRLIEYSRGQDQLDSIEFTLWREAIEKGVTPHHWLLYPKQQIRDAAWNGRTDVKDGYWSNRRQLCRVLYDLRMRTWLTQQIPGARSFEPEDARIAAPDQSPDANEIMNAH